MRYFWAQFYKILTEGSLRSLKKRLSRQAEKEAVQEKILSVREDGQNLKIVIKI